VVGGEQSAKTHRIAAQNPEFGGAACGNCRARRDLKTKARRTLGWQPTVDFTTLITMMVDADLVRVAGEPQATHRLSAS